MRWNNPPEKPASKIRHENLPDLCATKTRRIYSPENTPLQLEALRAREPPFPAQNPQARPGPPSLPSPPATPPTEEGGGGGDPARLAHASWTGTFTFIPFYMNGYIFLYDTTYTYSAQSGLMWKYNYIALRRKNHC